MERRDQKDVQVIFDTWEEEKRIKKVLVYII